MAAEKDVFAGDDAPAPLVLTREELAVLKECRWNSIAYRGVPLGLFGAGIARAVVKAGYFKKWSGLCYAGMVGFGFFTGVGSYRTACLEKIMALENSQLGDQLRGYQKRVGIPVTERPESSEFQDDISRFDSRDKIEDEVGQRQDGGSQWDEIRKQSRQMHTSSERGMSFEELRRKNRSNQLAESKQIAPSEESEDKPMSPDFESFTSQKFNSDKLTGLNFTKDEDSKIFAFMENSDDSNVNNESTKKTRKTYSRGVPHKNKYGDDVE